MEPRDPFLEKWWLRERAEEDLYFARRDRDLLARLHEATEEEQRALVREIARLRCRECGARLVSATRYGVTIEECPRAHGMWMTGAEMRTLARRERNSWIARYFYRPKAVV